MIINKKILITSLTAGGALLAALLRLSLRPVEIVAVHQDGNYSSVLVKNFPITDNGKISWWLKNKILLKAQHDIPKPASYGSYTIIFWDFGDGYKEEGKYDRLCFADMETKKNCIEKEKVMTIQRINKKKPFFSINGKEYKTPGESND